MEFLFLASSLRSVSGAATLFMAQRIPADTPGRKSGAPDRGARMERVSVRPAGRRTVARIKIVGELWGSAQPLRLRRNRSRP
jgi:hypothetical protein